MEAFGIIGMTFGLMSWIRIQAVAKELADLKESLNLPDQTTVEPSSSGTQ